MHLRLSLAVESLFSRLSSPVPITKLLVSIHLATILTNEETTTVCNEALTKALHEARFESEVAELLSVPLLGRSRTIDVDALRTSIRFPSILSDSMLSLLNGRRFAVQAWISAHSGAAPSFHSTQSLEILQKAQIIPPFVGMQLSHLEKHLGVPVLR